MMGLDERFLWLILGCLIGFFAGYITRSLRDIKANLHEVEECLHTCQNRECSTKCGYGQETEETPDDVRKPVHARKRDEGGFMRHPIVADVMVILVVLLTAFAAFQSQRASSNVQSTQDDLDRVTSCNQLVLEDLLSTIEERSTFTAGQFKANLKLQQAQSEFFGILLSDPPYAEPVRAKAARKYFEALNSYVNAATKNLEQSERNPYPTVEDFNSCLVSDEKDPTKEE